MHDTQMSGELQMRWIPVVDERGRTRMETRWVLGSQVAAPDAALDTTPRVTHAA